MVMGYEFSLVFASSLRLLCLPSLGLAGLRARPVFDLLILMRDQSCCLQ